MAKDEHGAVADGRRRGEGRPYKGRTDPHPLEGRQNGDRSKGKRRDVPVRGLDHDAGEDDMADNPALCFGNQGEAGVEPLRRPDPPDQSGLFIAAKRRNVQIEYGPIIFLDLGPIRTDISC